MKQVIKAHLFTTDISDKRSTSGDFELWQCRLNRDCTASWTIRCPNPCRHKIFPSSPDRPDRHWSPPSVLFNGEVGYFTRVIQPERDDDHSPPFI